jgi:hypothetical protein
LRLLKEARAFGLGLMLVTQNPMDLDYKGLTNAGTWFVGKLQTDRDKARVLEGLEGVGAANRDELDRLIGALDSRVFLLHNVHDQGPRVFQTRWAMSYLRGPLTRAELRRLDLTPHPHPPLPSPTGEESAVGLSSAPRGCGVWGPGVWGEARPVVGWGVGGRGEAEAPLPSEIHQYYLPVSLAPDQVLRRWALAEGKTLPPGSGDEAALHYVPALLAQGVVRFYDRKSGLSEEQVGCCLVRTVDRSGLIRWEEHLVPSLDPDVLGLEPFGQATFDAPPAPLTVVKKLAELERDFINHLYRTMTLTLWHNPTLKAYSQPGQNEVAFRAACEESARRARDAELARLDLRYETRLDALRLKITTAERRLEALQAEVDSRKSEQGWTNIESVWDALTKRRIRRPISTAQRAQRMSEQAQLDLEATRVKLDTLKEQLTDLEAQRAADSQSVSEKWFQAVQATRTLVVTPKKADVRTELFGIGWIPYWILKVEADTLQLPAFEN